MDAAVERDDRFLVERNGHPAVLIMSVADYIKSIAPEDEVLSAIQNNAKGAGLDKLSMDDIDSEIAAYRREEGANTPSHA